MSTPRWMRRILSVILPGPGGTVGGAAATYRARLLSALCIGMTPILVLVMGVTVAADSGKPHTTTVVAAAFVMLVALAGAFLLNRAGRTTHAGLAIAAAAAVVVCVVTVAEGVDSRLSMPYLAPVVVLAGVLLPPRVAVVAIALATAEAALLPLFVPSMRYAEALAPMMVVAVSAALAVVVTWQTELLDRDRSVDLAAGEDRYRLLFESNPHPMWVYDLETLGFLAVNPAAVRRYGYTAEEYAGMTLRDIRPPEDMPRLLSNVSRVTGGRDEAGVWRHLRKDGSLIWVEITSHTLEYDGRPAELVLAVDVTERKRADDEREAQHAILQGIIEHTDAAVLSLDRDYRYTSFNQTHAAVMEDLYGTSIALGDSMLERMTVEADRSVAKRSIDRSLAGEVHTQESFAGDEARARRCFQGSHSPVVDTMGEIIGAAVIARDVTERRREEAEARALTERMLHAQKLESLGMLAGGIAHDFNNILMAVLGHAELARTQLGPLSPAHDSLMEIERAASRASGLAKQMLAYSGKGRFQVQALDLNELTRDMRHMLEVSIPKKTSIVEDLSPGLPPVEADATQLQQVLMNLVINASEAMGESGGVVRIATGWMDCDEDYLTHAWAWEDLQPGRYTFLEVADTGVGMDADTAARVFDPFFSTKFTGRGLGLAAVLGIVRGHGGGVKVQSEPGRGTTFTMLLPAVEETPASRPEEPAVVDWAGAGTVLLVDDEEPLRRLGSRMLRRLGFKALIAGDGEEALEVYRERREEIACVILDLTMPRMDGEEAYRELRRLDPDLPVILSSGYSEQDVTRRFADAGMAGFIQKPYQLAELAARLRTALGS